ncbi:MAG: hypothetical protein ACFFAQ_04990 [Promethearchaeota archaeon]
MKKGLRLGLIITSLIIVCGVTVFGIAIIVTWDEYNDSYVFYYKPETSSSIEKISINTDIGKINLKYNTTPTDYYAKIDADIHVVGPFVKEKSFSDFFKPIIWINESTTVIKFSLESKPMSWIMFIGGSKIKINVTLRTDVIYDINAEATTGAVVAIIPDNTTHDQINLEVTTGSVKLYATGANFTNNLRAIATTGNVKLNFTNCILAGNITSRITTGSLTLKSFNMVYTQSSNWNLDSTTGNVNIYIYQHSNMGADVIGSVDATTGNIKIVYEDTSPLVGSFYTADVTTGDIDYHDLGGFSQQSSGFGSDDFLATAIYTYILDLETTTGNIDIYGRSS